MGYLYKRGQIYQMAYRRNGRWVRQSTGTRWKEEAKCKLADTELRVFRGEELGVREEPVPAFRELTVAYLQREQTRGKRSFIRERIAVEKHLEPFFGSKPVNAITPRMIDDYISSRLARVQNATVNREVGIFRHILNIGIKWGYLKTNPVAGYVKLEEPPGRLRFLTEAELGALFNECDAYLRAVAITLLHTGMRKGEAEALRWEDVDFTRRLITLRASKNNTRRAIPMSETLVAELQRLRRQRLGDMVFYRGRFRKALENAIRRAGIKDFRPHHDFRHTWASYMAMAGASLLELMEIGGWKSLKMVMRYAHLSPSHLQGAAARLDAKYAQAATQITTQSGDPKISTSLSHRF